MDVPSVALGSASCRRILNGMWQVSGAHGAIDSAGAVAAMHAYHAAGLTTWDLADHYGAAEDFIGTFRREVSERTGPASLEAIQAFTKWVPPPGPMTRDIVTRAIDLSRSRMDMETLDLLQFHWWDYDDDRYLDALAEMVLLREAGIVRELALTNFDTQRLATIIDAGIPIVSNQVQYSLIDRRPAFAMTPLCAENGVQLLTYGTLAGGLLTDRYLDVAEPNGWALDTASLRKYKQMVDLRGGWAHFQELLATLRRIADRHNVSIANVATRWVLDQAAVAGVIIGVRLGVADHRDENLAAFEFELDEEDNGDIDRALAGEKDLMQLIGDCGDEYR